MQGYFAAKRILMVIGFFLTMLLMKEVMDALLPPPPPYIPVRGRHMKPGAMLDIEAEAEEAEIGPEVVEGQTLQEQVDALEGDAAVDEAVVKGMRVSEGEEEASEGDDQVVEPAQPEEEAIEEEEGGGEGEELPRQRPLVTPPSAKKAFSSKSTTTTPSSKLSSSKSKKQSKGGDAVPTFGPNYYGVVIDRNTKMDSVQILPRSDLFQFQIKACSDAYLIYKQTKAADEYSYHIGFGYGKKTVIWKQPPDPVTKEFMTPEEGLLRCDEYVAYWVQLKGAKFNVGLDANPEPFISWKDPKPFTIGAISLATPHPKQKVVWNLDIRSIHTLRVDTGEDYSYEQAWVTAIGRNAIVLQVKACRDAHVLLSDKEGEIGNAYEVAIGMADNSKTSIREDKFGPNMITVDTPDILHCDETRAFWFRWEHHKLSMGRGTKLGGRTLINYGKENHPAEIRSVALSTGWGATGRWLFNMEENVMYPSTS